MKLLLVISTFILVSCAHHRDVRPSDSGIHSVAFQTEDKSSGYQNAISQARHFCEESKKQAFVVKEGYRYVGSMKEEDYNKTKTVSKIAKGIGGSTWVMGGKNESTAGGVMALGGQVADSVAGAGYTYTMSFKCK